MTQDETFLREAIKEARKALSSGDIPVGALLVVEGKIVARGHNQREARQDPFAHAEIEAVRKAARKLGTWRVAGTLYCTLEPCAMCAGAMIQARIERLVFGAFDPKAGAAGSVVGLFKPGLFNHDVVVEGGLLADECAALLQQFFQALRAS